MLWLPLPPPPPPPENGSKGSVKLEKYIDVAPQALHLFGDYIPGRKIDLLGLSSQS